MVWWCNVNSQADRLLEALEIWKNESDQFHDYEEQCRLAGKEVWERV